MNDTTCPVTAGSSSALDEGRLIERLRAGDERAGEEMVRQYAGRMLAVARRLLRSEEDGADAVQDAFLSVFRSLGSFMGQASLGTWLHRIVVNACLMKLRSRSRRRDVPIDDLLPTFDETGCHAQPVRPWADQAATQFERAEMRAQVRLHRSVAGRASNRAASPRHRGAGHRRNGSPTGHGARSGEDAPAPARARRSERCSHRCSSNLPNSERRCRERLWGLLRADLISGETVARAHVPFGLNAVTTASFVVRYGPSIRSMLWGIAGNTAIRLSWMKADLPGAVIPPARKRTTDYTDNTDKK